MERPLLWGGTLEATNGLKPEKLRGNHRYVFSGLAFTALWPPEPLGFWECSNAVVIAAIIEALPKPLDDNFIVPLVAALLCG